MDRKVSTLIFHHNLPANVAWMLQTRIDYFNSCIFLLRVSGELLTKQGWKNHDPFTWVIDGYYIGQNFPEETEAHIRLHDSNGFVHMSFALRNYADYMRFQTISPFLK